MAYPELLHYPPQKVDDSKRDCLWDVTTYEGFSGTERRSGLDRRVGSMPMFSKYWLTGRRASFRRQEDRLIYDRPDRYSARILAVILVIIMLSVIDAIFTLRLLSDGAVELNPIMAYYLEYGPLAFFGTKYSLTCASILIIFLNHHVYLFNNRIPMKVLYVFMIVPYLFIVHWEIYLMIFR